MVEAERHDVGKAEFQVEQSCLKAIGRRGKAVKREGAAGCSPFQPFGQGCGGAVQSDGVGGESPGVVPSQGFGIGWDLAT